MHLMRFIQKGCQPDFINFGIIPLSLVRLFSKCELGGSAMGCRLLSGTGWAITMLVNRGLAQSKS